MNDPRVEYRNRLARHSLIAAGKERLHIRCGNLKLLVVAIGVVVVALALGGRLSGYWILFPAALFAFLVVVHERILRERDHAQTAVALYQRGLARIDDNWAGSGASGDRFRDPKHVYAEDLDLFGRGCLFELLSTARLPMGEERLARWLTTASPLTEIIERQGLVAELGDRLDLREDIAVTGEDLKPRLNAESLIAWAEGKPLLTAKAPRVVFVLISVASIVALRYSLHTLVPLAVVLVIALVLYSIWRRRASEVMDGVHSNAEGLMLFSKILLRIEREQFASPRLKKETAALTAGPRAASRAIRDFARIVFWMDAREGLITRILELPMMYSLQVAFAADAWRMRWGPKLREWVETVGEMEGLLSLATYSYEHPADPFPEFVSRAGSGPRAHSGGVESEADANANDAMPVFDGRELGHPLIAEAKCVRNTVVLDRNTRVMLVSGSNMSGKSTLLRTVGINVVLANAGAPIRGKALRLSPVALGTRIRSADSLQEGRSNFFTEILHIRQVFDLVGGHNGRLLFLFDELLEGTNSKDRRIGAEGLLRALVQNGAIGIVTTHDLALTAVTVTVGNIVRNYHFQDYVENGQMRFDYTLREGVVAKSNAIELMRLIGLKV